MNTYILDENDEPQACDDLLAWATWMSTIDRRLLFTVVGDSEVSTVFLGVDYRHIGNGPPLLWETMIFGGAHNRRIVRYTSKLDALTGHADVVAALELAERHVGNQQKQDDQHYRHPEGRFAHRREQSHDERRKK